MIPAFRDLQALLAVADREAWIWPFCASKVADHGRTSIEAAHLASGFWRIYRQFHPDDKHAEAEELLCFSLLRTHGIATEMTFEKFVDSVGRLTQQGITNPAFLWDRAGHWAQDASDWKNAEACFRRAYELDGGHYGYCWGVALNFLGQYEAALPLLQDQANIHQPDARSWFQVAVAKEGTGDPKGSIAAYLRALELDPDYELVLFNLGGMYLKQRDVANARRIWIEALRRFPEHELSQRIKENYASLLHAPQST